VPRAATTNHLLIYVLSSRVAAWRILRYRSALEAQNAAKKISG